MKEGCEFVMVGRIIAAEILGSVLQNTGAGQFFFRKKVAGAIF